MSEFLKSMAVGLFTLSCMALAMLSVAAFCIYVEWSGYFFIVIGVMLMAFILGASIRGKGDY